MRERRETGERRERRERREEGCRRRTYNYLLATWSPIIQVN